MPSPTMSPAVPNAAVPYDYPWGTEKNGSRQLLLGLAGVGLLVLAAVMALSNLMQGKTLEAAAGAIFLGSLGIASLGAAIRVAKPRGGIQFINAVVLTEAEKAPTDSWVHLVRFRKAHIGAVIIIFAGGLGLLAMTALGVHHVLTTSTDAEGLLRLIPASILGVLGVLITVLGVSVLIMGTRTTSVGQRPVGVAVGESGFMLNLLGLDAELPWASIESVDAGTITVGRGRRGEQAVATIDIRADGKLHCLTIASLSTPPLLAYAALKFYLDNPNLRGELGTTTAQTRFDTWHKAVVSR